MSLPPYYAHGRTVRMRPLPVLLPDGRTEIETMDAAITQLCAGIDAAAAERIADVLNGNEAMTWNVICALRHLDRLLDARTPAKTSRGPDDPLWEARNYLRQAIGEPALAGDAPADEQKETTK